MFQSDSTTANLIARTALDHYSKVLPTNKGKPQADQWTVYSAIVATRQVQKPDPIDHIDAWVVSCATGSKCTTMHPALSHFGDHIPECQGIGIGKCKIKCCAKQIRGCVLHDSHAEVLARRGLVRALWREILYHLKHNGEPMCTKKMRKNLLQVRVTSDNEIMKDSERPPTEVETLTFELKDDVVLHLYISDSPCGDASIYDISPKYASDNNSGSTTGLSFTGAKIIIPQNDDDKTNNNGNFFQCSGLVSKPQDEMTRISSVSKTAIAREKVQIKSALRLKSGRSNIPDHLRSSSMSCSDKICKWIVMGLQGSGALARFIPKKIFISNIVISQDPRILDITQDLKINPQLKALRRALVSRAENVLKSIKKDDSCLNYDSIKIPSIHISDHIFSSGKANSEKKMIDKSIVSSLREYDTFTENNTDEKCQEEFAISQIKSKKRNIGNISHGSLEKSKIVKKQKASPCGISLNWQMPFLGGGDNEGGIIEQVVGAKGIIQRKKPKNSDDVMKCTSRLSRYSLCNQTLEALTLSKIINLENQFQPSIKMNFTYQQMKQNYAPPAVRKLSNLILRDSKNPLQGWVKSSSDGDFYPHVNQSKLS